MYIQITEYLYLSKVTDMVATKEEMGFDPLLSFHTCKHHMPRELLR